MELRRVRAGEVELEIAEAGAGDRKLLLVHGFTGGKEDFTMPPEEGADDGWVDRLAARGWHVVAPDQRGHGASDAPGDESAYSFETYAADVVALVDALGWDRFALLGHSMGGMVAQLVALASPDRLTGLVLMDTSHGPLELPEGEAQKGVTLARERGMAHLYDRQQERGSLLQSPAGRRLDETRPGWKDFGRRKFVACSPAMFCAMAVAFGRARDRLDALSSLEVPTLVLVGEQDLPFMAPSERMAKTIPGATLAVVPDAGHSPQFEAPDAWWGALSAFLDGIGSGAVR